MKKIAHNKFLLLLFAVIIFIVAFLSNRSLIKDSSSNLTHFEKTLNNKEKRLTQEMLELAKRTKSQNYNQLFALKPTYYNTLLEEEGLVLLIYENDTLKFWSDNSIAVENWVKEVCLDSKMAKLRNGWFEVMQPPTNASTTKTIIGLVLIKNEYPYQNKYLRNEFQKDFAAPAETKLITDSTANTFSSLKTTRIIHDYNGEYLFSLQFNPANNSISFSSYLSVFLNLIGFIISILFLKKVCLSFANRISRNSAVLLFIFLILVLRYLSIEFSFPESFYNFDLFGPKIYADSNSIWLSSLGDLFINVLLLFYISYFIYKEFTFDKIFNKLKSLNKLVLALFFFLIYFWFSSIVTSLFTGLIKNSNIPFSLNNLFSLNQYSYIGIVTIGFLLFSYFLIADKIVSFLKQLRLTTKQYLFLFLVSAGVRILIAQFLGTFDLIAVLWAIILIFTIVLLKKKEVIYPFSGIVFLVFLFSIYAVHFFIKHSEIKEKQIREVYASKLAAEQDTIAELLFEDVEKKLNSDSILVSYLTGSEKNISEFEKRLKQQYFSGFWEKYDLRIALFDSTCVPLIKSQNILYDNSIYFDELITNNGTPTTCEHFNFLKNESGKISYLAKLPLYKNAKHPVKFVTLYLELDAKFISEEIGFPELLLDRNIGLSQELNNYSYAKYKHNQLVNQYGKFQYSLSWTDSDLSKNNSMFFDLDDFNHLVFKPDNETIIVLSKRNDGLIGEVTTLSYLFAFFSLLLLLVLFIRQVSLGHLFENFSFKYRIQVLLVLIVLISLALFGGGTIYYINEQFEMKNRENISEKIHSVLIDTESKLSSENSLNLSLVDYISFVLKKSSSVFFTDINLYDTHGNLYCSSRSKLFDEGLISKKMNPEAFLQIAILGKTEFIHDERIGKLEYLSAYIPYKNKEGKLLAYFNLPYFAKQSALEKEISGFLVALINIYVLLFALSIVIAIFISNYVTKPLKLIQIKLSNIKLGKKNELIEWSEKDEIGNLVSEYNRMISELAKSAELLAKSEREGAWREMAKQVAHEIKNPLTPMKLSVQHLQRTWKDNAPDMNQKMERLTQTIIEQIDLLSSIATAFSNFAIMPKANLEKNNIEEILLNSISLFHIEKGIHINFNNETKADTLILADKEQLLRVFNNLLKNAIQAIPESKQGIIYVVLKKENNQFIISISDNGIGIADDIVDNIFTPNFTTKTSGTGLGLAMVKNMVESMEGRIWFTTEVKIGTTFFVALPAYDDK